MEDYGDVFCSKIQGLDALYFLFLPHKVKTLLQKKGLTPASYRVVDVVVTLYNRGAGEWFSSWKIKSGNRFVIFVPPSKVLQ